MVIGVIFLLSLRVHGKAVAFSYLPQICTRQFLHCSALPYDKARSLSRDSYSEYYRLPDRHAAIRLIVQLPYTCVSGRGVFCGRLGKLFLRRCSFALFNIARLF